MKKEKILILSGELGDGHKQAANALLEAAGMHKPHMCVEIVDFMELVTPRLHSMSKYLFVQSVKKFPSVYGYLYRKTRKPNTWSHMLKKLNYIGIQRLVKLIDTRQPTIIVSTFPMASAAISVLKTNDMLHVPSVTIITDHTDHSYWLHDRTDLYIVGSEHVKQALENAGVDVTRIQVTGIPIRSSFHRTYNTVQLRRHYGLSLSMPTILIMGGGFGMIGKGLIKLLHGNTLSQSMQFIIVCGRNEKLKEGLKQALVHSKHRIRVMGYVSQIHELMALSDLMITKPGGLTTAEAIAMQLPMLLYRALPGQEEDNSKYLIKAGVALQADDYSDLSMQLERLIDIPALLWSMREQAEQLITGEDSSLKALESITATAVHKHPATIPPAEQYAHAL